MSFIIVAKARNLELPACQYLAKNGFFTYNANKAVKYATLKAASDEFHYFVKFCPALAIRIEQLPSGRMAMLRSKEVDALPA